jgi:hypothetical protein
MNSFLGQFCNIAQVAIIGRKLVRLNYELDMALENFKHIYLIFGYLLDNHVRKCDDFSLNLVEFRLLRLSKSI